MMVGPCNDVGTHHQPTNKEKRGFYRFPLPATAPSRALCFFVSEWPFALPCFSIFFAFELDIFIFELGFDRFFTEDPSSRLAAGSHVGP